MTIQRQHGSFRTRCLLGSCVFALGIGGTGFAQGTPATEDDDVIVVTGTNVKGADLAGTLPVVTLDEADIEAIGSLDGDDLVRSLAGQGAVDFRDDNTSTVNNARGDVSSINLRSLGPGNTLVLLNGRRVVSHPGTQSENLVPAVTVNTNALPVAGISRVEVLNDGASSIYGADAVAGVFNSILKSNYTGQRVSLRHGYSEGTNFDQTQLTYQGGWDFNEGKTNLSIAGSYSLRGALDASERYYSANNDLRDLLVGGYFEGDTSFRNTNSRSPWGQFTLDTTSSTRVRQDGGILTSSSGVFHIQPDTFAGCRGTTADDLATPGICIDDGSVNSDLWYNRGSVRQLISARDRVNLFAFLNHDLDNGVELYGEAGYYFAENDQRIEGNTPIGSDGISIPASNYWNPFGPVTFSDGRLNPNRLPGLSNVPDEGLPVFVDAARFRLVDVGPRIVNVKNASWRALAGARGDWENGWSWDTAILWSEAETNDTTSNRLSSTLFQELLFDETPGAYNFFNGGNLDDVNNGDTTVNPPSSYEAALIDVSRISRTALGLVDFKISRPDLFSLPAGNVGAAFGVEARHEQYEEDRDPRLDGTITYTDQVTGTVVGSDVMGTSPTADSTGYREVYSAFGEFLVPVISPEMEIPLVHRFDMQLSGRIEEFSDIGSSGFKPKVAASWEPFDFLKFRGAYSEGFRAPNLPQVNENGVFRSNTLTDSIFCEAGVRNGTFAEYSDCEGYTESREERREGNADLEPEEDTNITYGVVFQPRDWTGPFEFLNNLTITADRWEIAQEGVVGIFGGGNHMDLDYARRVQGGSNPAVVREAPNEDQIAFFAGTGLEAVGDVLYIDDVYLNLLPRTFMGVDYAIYYEVPDTAWGDFDFKVNAAFMDKAYVEESPRALEIKVAQDDGQIDDSISVSNSGTLIEQNGIPEWQGGATLTWRHDSGFGAGARLKYVGEYIDTSAGLNPDGEAFIVESWTTGNLYVQYQFEEDKGLFPGMRFRLGANNITDEDPPLVDITNGYDAGYHSAKGRYVYFDIQKKF